MAYDQILEYREINCITIISALMILNQLKLLAFDRDQVTTSFLNAPALSSVFLFICTEFINHFYLVIKAGD